MDTNYPLLASAIAISVGLVRILEVLVVFIVKKLGSNKEDERNKLIYTIHDKLNLLTEWHNKTNDKGCFIWYFDPEVLDSLKALLEQSNETAYTQRDLIKGFDKVIVVLEKIDRKQDVLESQRCGVKDCSGRVL